MVAMINISERRRDFATLDAIGTPKRTIFRIVVTETAFIGLIGGLIGIFLGSIAAIFIVSVYTEIPLVLFFTDLLKFVPPLFMITILISTVIVSAIAGIISAIATLRMNVAEMLRAEY